MKRLLLIAYISFTVLISLLSQEYSFPELNGYKRLADYPVYNSDNLRDILGGEVESYLSLGFEELRIAEYKKGRHSIMVEIFRHKDNYQAFGIYSAERLPSFRYINIGAQGNRAGSSLNFYKGRYYVKIRTNSSSGKVVQSLETLALRVADMLPGDAALPKTLFDFPESGRKPNEETYIKTGVLGHNFLSGAFKAHYEAGENVFSIFIIDCKSAEETLKMVNSYLEKAGLDPDNSGDGKYIFKDGYNGTIFLSWKESRIVIIQGLEKDQTDIADRYTTEILK